MAIGTTIPLTPFLARKGEEFVAEGHPFDKLRAGSQTPGKGASPLCTPHSSSACECCWQSSTRGQRFLTSFWNECSSLGGSILLP